MLAALRIPTLEAAKFRALGVRESLASFAMQTAAFVRGPELRAALIGTGIFWGAGAALRFLLIAWVPAELNIVGTSMPGFLTGMVAAGIAVGAVLAGRFVKLERRSARCRRAFCSDGRVPSAAGQDAPRRLSTHGVRRCLQRISRRAARCIATEAGTERGGVGSAIAIQNLFENLSMLALLAGYTAAAYARVPVNVIAFGFAC